MADEQAKPKGGGATRRQFLSAVGVGWMGFLASGGVGTAALVRFLFPNVSFEPPKTFKAGYPDEYQVGRVEEKYKSAQRVWIVRTGDGIYALLAICTHLGCPPNWFESEQKFKCPCHGSGFYKSGINFEGPAPRPLERVRVTLADDGQVLVDKSRRYQYEKGQWSDPESFLRV